MKLYLHAFLTLARGGVEWSDSRPGRFIPGTHTTSRTIRSV